ncbi:MAG: NAD(P)H-hydrate dehydratase, partial [Chloroflexota bacterium]|nr:NAD(P)H-hydrate dehydratase [Chloroflexota bacterium]
MAEAGLPASSAYPGLRLVTAAEMRGLEQGAVSRGFSLETLMDNAGLAAAREVHVLADGQAGRALVLVGPGNNGGDGLVCAEHLREWGWQVLLHLVPQKERDTARFKVLQHIQPGPVPQEPVDIVVDALLGTGSSRPIQGAVAEAVEAVRSSQRQARIVALDLPSGVQADTGGADPKTLAADLTVTLGLAKVGLFQFPARALSGDVHVVDIGIPAELNEDVATWLSEPQLAARFLPARPRDAHKGTFGKLLAIAGCASYTGAPYLTSVAAMRVGAGLVRIALARTVHPIVAGKFTEATFAVLPETDDGCLSLQAWPRLRELLAEDFDCLLVGPGLGRHPETAEVLRLLLLDGMPLPPRVVIDADGLNNLSTQADWPARLPHGCVLTPHPAEFGRLSGLPVGEVIERRFELARTKAREWSQVIVAKGANTIIAAPDGRTVVDPGANPLVATAGT